MHQTDHTPLFHTLLIGLHPGEPRWRVDGNVRRQQQRQHPQHPHTWGLVAAIPLTGHGGGGAVSSVAWSPDGRWLLAAGGTADELRVLGVSVWLCGQ